MNLGVGLLLFGAIAAMIALLLLSTLWETR